MNNLWWKEISGARRIIDSIFKAVENEKNVILKFSPSTPWIDDFREVLSEKIEIELTEQELKQINYSEADVGDYMLQNFCRETVRVYWRPPEPVGKFLGKCEDLTLSDKILWVKLQNKKQLEDWLSFISEYDKTSGKENRKAVFLLEIDDSFENLPEKKYFEVYKIGDEIPEYVRYTYASVLASEADIKDSMITYLSKLATSCCNDIELIPLCINEQRSFMENPYDTMVQLIADNCRSDGSDFVLAGDHSRIDYLVWQAQLKILFPSIERYRVYLIQKMSKQIKDKLQFPYKTNFGDLDSPEELELKDLTYAIGNGRLLMDDSKEYNRLERFREYRNSLAHGKPLSFEDVKFLLGNVMG